MAHSAEVNNKVLHDIIAMNFDLWDEHWTESIAKAAQSPERSRYSVQALKEVILLENTLISSGNTAVPVENIRELRVADVGLLQERLATQIAEQLEIKDWKVRVSLTPP
jgi:hypothetical protein